MMNAVLAGTLTAPILTGLVVLCLASAAPTAQFAHGERQGDVQYYERRALEIRAGELPYHDFYFEYPPGALAAIMPPAFAPSSYGLAFRIQQWLLCAAVLVLTCLSLARLGAGRLRVLAGAILVGLTPLALGSVLFNRFDLLPRGTGRTLDDAPRDRPPDAGHGGVRGRDRDQDLSGRGRPRRVRLARDGDTARVAPSDRQSASRPPPSRSCCRSPSSVSEGSGSASTPSCREGSRSRASAPPCSSPPTGPACTMPRSCRRCRSTSGEPSPGSSRPRRGCSSWRRWRRSWSSSPATRIRISRC